MDSRTMGQGANLKKATPAEIKELERIVKKYEALVRSGGPIPQKMLENMRFSKLLIEAFRPMFPANLMDRMSVSLMALEKRQAA